MLGGLPEQTESHSNWEIFFVLTCQMTLSCLLTFSVCLCCCRCCPPIPCGCYHSSSLTTSLLVSLLSLATKKKTPRQSLVSPSASFSPRTFVSRKKKKKKKKKNRRWPGALMVFRFTNLYITYKNKSPGLSINATRDS